MTCSRPTRGPLAGEPVPVHGGTPGEGGCGGCVDCCNLPEIAVTAAEAQTLLRLYDDLDRPAGKLRIIDDPQRRDWRIMLGPCAFRKIGDDNGSGGCRIYAECPGSCRIFTCSYLLELRRRVG